MAFLDAAASGGNQGVGGEALTCPPCLYNHSRELAQERLAKSKKERIVCLSNSTVGPAFWSFLMPSAVIGDDSAGEPKLTQRKLV